MTIQRNNTITVFGVFICIMLHVVIINAVFNVFYPTGTLAGQQTLFVMKGRPAVLPQQKKKREKAKEAVKTPVKKNREAISPKTAAPEPESLTEEVDEVPEADEIDNDGTEELREGEEGLSGTGTSIDLKAVILQQIINNKIYPKAARKRFQEGFVTLHIIVAKTGDLVQVDIIEPCQYKFLNQAAIATVKSAAPFPVKDMAIEQVELTVTLQYQLEG